MIYESERNKTIANEEKLMLFGECNLNLNYNEKGIYYVRVKDESYVNLTVGNNAFVMLYLYGQTTSASITNTDDTACVKVYRVNGMAMEDTVSVIKGINDVEFN